MAKNYFEQFWGAQSDADIARQNRMKDFNASTRMLAAPEFSSTSFGVFGAGLLAMAADAGRLLPGSITFITNTLERAGLNEDSAILGGYLSSLALLGVAVSSAEAASQNAADRAGFERYLEQEYRK